MPPPRTTFGTVIARRCWAIPDLSPLPWIETLLRISNLPSLDPIDWAIAAIVYGNRVAFR
jgi:hypothetical protein